MARHVQAEGAEIINGVKTFGSFPETPSSAPTTDYQIANKKYVDDKPGIRPYKVYTAKLAQTLISTTSGLLVIGKIYHISTLETGDNFTNVGYTTPATDFLATGTTPTVWSNGTVVVNQTDSIPIATVLENTLGWTPTWIRTSIGTYVFVCPAGISLDKCFTIIQNNNIPDYLFIVHAVSNSGTVVIIVETYFQGSKSDNLMDNGYGKVCFEIRVYP